MPIQAGQMLCSLSISQDDYFYQALVYIAEYNREGALGFVVDRPFPRRLNELIEFDYLPPFPLYEGGPVDEEHLYFLHRRPDIVTGGREISGGVYYGGNFAQATSGIKEGMLTQGDLRIFIGYCGWHAGDLEEELSNEEWKLETGSPFS